MALASGVAAAAEPQWIAVFGRGTESAETDIVRLAYRYPLKDNGAWWKPSHAQFGASGIGLQHLSNAGIKQPNGGIDLVLIQYTVSTGTPNR